MVKKKKQSKSNIKKPSKKQEVSSVKKKKQWTKFKAIIDDKWVTLIPEKNKKENPVAKEVFVDSEELTTEEDIKKFFFIKREKEKDKKLCPFTPWRKVEYKPEFCNKMIDFFTEVKNEIAIIRSYYKPDYRQQWEDISMLPTWDKAWPVKSIFPRELAPVFPTFQRFCTNIWIVRSTMYDWIKIFPELNDTYIYCKELQHAILIEWTMLGLFKDNFTQFLLKNEFDYKEESTVKVDDQRKKEDKEMSEEELMKELAEIQKKKNLASKQESEWTK
jgi:hypothetical protein